MSGAMNKANGRQTKKREAYFKRRETQATDERNARARAKREARRNEHNQSMTLAMARAIQFRRVKAGKYGYAKSVRRTLWRESGHNLESYKVMRDQLPVVWPTKKQENAI